MKTNTKDMLKIIGCIALFIFVVTGIGSCKYKFWRAEHPNSPTWTFFIPKGK